MINQLYCTGMKTEWATVQGSNLYVGTHGIEKTYPNKSISYVSMWVKKISQNGQVESVNWQNNYMKIQMALGITSPGYVIHEACTWSEIHKMWFMMPRKVSAEAFDADKDEHKGSNVLLIIPPNFDNIKLSMQHTQKLV